MSTRPSNAGGAEGGGGSGSALAPADAAALPGLLQCLCAWGRADAVLDAGMKALRASAEQLFKGEPLDHDGVTGLDVHVAILCIRHIAALSSDAEGGAAVGASVGKLSEAMTALKQTATYCQRAMSICHQQAVSGAASADPRCLLAVMTEGVALQLYALSVSCMDAWISLVMQQAALAVPAAAAPGAELAASAAYVEGQLAFIARWACESMLRTVLQFADGVDQHAGSYADPAVIARMVPLEVGCRAVFASLAAASADYVAMGMALPSALGLLSALTSADQVVLGASAPALGAAGSAAAAAAGAGAPILSGFAPVEWLGNISFLSAYYAAAFGGSGSGEGRAAAAASGVSQDMPVEVAASYGAVLRLAMCLQAWASSAAAAGAAAAVAPAPPILNPAALSADQRAVIVTGMTRLLMLAPDAEPELPADAAAEVEAEEEEEDDAASTASSVARGAARRSAAAAAAAAARPTPAEVLVRRTVSSALGGILGSAAGSASGSATSSSGRAASSSRDAGAGVSSGAAAPSAGARSAAIEFLSESLRLVEMEIDTSAEAFTAFVARPRPSTGATGGGRRRGGRAGAGARAGTGMAVDDDEEGCADVEAEGTGSALVLAGAPAASAAQALGPVPHAFIATAAASAPVEAAQALATRIGVLAEVFMVPAASAADEEGGSGGTGAAAADPRAGTTPVEPNCVACLAVIIAAVETATAAAKRGSVPAAAVSEAKATLRSVLSRLAFQPHAALDTAFAVLQDE
jgi:hypothetical protein